MANLQLLPGYGSRYTSASIAGAASPGTNGADTLDTSRCCQFAVQVSEIATAGSSTLQVQQTLDGVHWANLGTALVLVLGAITRFSAVGGPYGLIRLVVIDAAGAVTVQFTVLGFEMQGIV